MSSVIASKWEELKRSKESRYKDIIYGEKLMEHIFEQIEIWTSQIKQLLPDQRRSYGPMIQERLTRLFEVTESEEEDSSILARLKDGIIQPDKLEDLVDMIPKTYQPTVSPRESLQILPLPKNGLENLFNDFDIFNSNRSKKESTLTDDEELIIFAYSYEIKENGTSTKEQIYSGLTNAQRSAKKDISVLNEYYLPFLYYLHNALIKLPSQETVVYRGVGINIDIDMYQPGTVIVWPGVSSTSEDANVAKKFLGSVRGNAGVLFVIQIRSGRDISFLSMFPHEKELLLPHNRCFRVKNILDDGIRKLLKVSPLVRIVVLEEIDDRNADAEITLVRSQKNWNAHHNVKLLKKDLNDLANEYKGTASGYYAKATLQRVLENDYESSKENFIKAILLCDNTRWDVLADYGSLLLSTGDYHNAVLQLKAAYRIDPRNEMVLGRLYTAYRMVRNFTEAELILQQLDAAFNSRASSIHSVDSIEILSVNGDNEGKSLLKKYLRR